LTSQVITVGLTFSASTADNMRLKPPKPKPTPQRFHWLFFSVISAINNRISIAPAFSMFSSVHI
jgi:hypothetical protein